MADNVRQIGGTDLDPEELEKAIQAHIAEAEVRSKKKITKEVSVPKTDAKTKTASRPKKTEVSAEAKNSKAKQSDKKDDDGQEIPVLVHSSVSGIIKDKDIDSTTQDGEKPSLEPSKDTPVRHHIKTVIEPLTKAQKAEASAPEETKPAIKDDESVETVETEEETPKVKSEVIESKNNKTPEEIKEGEENRKPAETLSKSSADKQSDATKSDDKLANQSPGLSQKQPDEPHDIKVFDTTKYHLPIKSSTKHRIRSSTGAFLIILFAIAATIYVGYKLNLIDLSRFNLS